MQDWFLFLMIVSTIFSSQYNVRLHHNHNQPFKLHPLCMCLKLEATPCKHMHGQRILRGRLMANSCMLAGCLACKHYCCSELPWHQYHISVQAIKLPHYYSTSFPAAQPRRGGCRSKPSYLCWYRLSSLLSPIGQLSPVFTARCTLVQSAVLRSHVVCLSVCLSVRDVGELWSHRLEYFKSN